MSNKDDEETIDELVYEEPQLQVVDFSEDKKREAERKEKLLQSYIYARNPYLYMKVIINEC